MYKIYSGLFLKSLCLAFDGFEKSARFQQWHIFANQFISNSKYSVANF